MVKDTGCFMFLSRYMYGYYNDINATFIEKGGQIFLFYFIIERLPRYSFLGDFLKFYYNF